MSIRTTIALLFLISVPLALLGWMGGVAIRKQQADDDRRFVEVAENRLSEWRIAVDEVLKAQHRLLAAELDRLNRFPEDLIDLERTEPIVRRVLWVSTRGQMLHPPPPTINDPVELALFGELSKIARQRPAVPKALSAIESEAVPVRQTRLSPRAVVGDSVAGESPEPAKDWNEWYFDQGLQLVVWKQLANGNAVGVLAERSKWMADLIASLPDSQSDAVGCTILEDAAGQAIYRWGQPEIDQCQVIASMDMNAPLSSWKLKYYSHDVKSTSRSMFSTQFPLIVSLASLGILLMAVGGYVLSSISRQLELAAQRVNFASQVSHELRTPLTNIRLYAELAANDLKNEEGALAAKTRQRLNVIDSESKRLGRLIHGVLEFMQSKTKHRAPNVSSAIPDDTIRSVICQFAPSMERNGIAVTQELHANDRVEFDSEILEQVLVNLFSNVEKYAAGGKSMVVKSCLRDQSLIVEVSDSGPGVASKYIHRIFKPFFRINDSITAPAGTGLGLTIARAAAKRHGGDLVALVSKTGASFRLTLALGQAACTETHLSGEAQHEA